MLVTKDYCRRALCCGLLLQCVASAAQDVTAPSEIDKPSVAMEQPPAVNIEQLVDDLGSPDFATRSAATGQLKAQSREVLPELKRVYGEVADHEIRLRLREIAESILTRDASVSLGGFLGVSLDRDKESARQQGRLNHLPEGVFLERVVPGTAAEEVGLQPGDLIFEVADGESTFRPGGITSFIQFVSAHPPGSTLQLHILREESPLIQEVTLGHRPANMFDLTSQHHRECLQRAQTEFAQWCADLPDPAAR